MERNASQRLYRTSILEMFEDVSFPQCSEEDQQWGEGMKSSQKKSHDEAE